MGEAVTDTMDGGIRDCAMIAFYIQSEVSVLLAWPKHIQWINYNKADVGGEGDKIGEGDMIWEGDKIWEGEKIGEGDKIGEADVGGEGDKIGEGKLTAVQQGWMVLCKATNNNTNKLNATSRK